MKRKTKAATLAGLGIESEEEAPQYSPLNPNVLIVPALGPRKTDFEPETDTERDEILRRAYAYLSERGVPYVPLDVEEDIEASYQGDDLETFRENVRGWIKALVRAQGRAA